MAIITVENMTYEVDPKKNLLESLLSLGLDLPYFCWHPAMGSVGSCRLCAVQQLADENDTTGRTVMACMTPAKEGSRFLIDHMIAKEFRSSVTESLMTNHPHDCPVCDEGGECHLQDMTVMTGHNHRRYRFSKRTYENQNLGPLINHEMNRCITCYRCVRYYHDLAGGKDLSAFKSSGNVYFGRFSDGKLASPFSGNLVEVCPTGVFTDKVYHQRYVRKWDLAASPSLCQQCGLGCNISAQERGGVLRRIRNRYHHDVNGFFICDRGRFGHDYVNAKNRLKTPMIKDSMQARSVSLAEAITFTKKLIADKKTMIGIGSPNSFLEPNWLIKDLVGADNFYDGQADYITRTMSTIIEHLATRDIEPASLKDVRESDAVIVIGEDLLNTAPMLSLCIRQAGFRSRQEKSRIDLDIPSWNDNAVRDYARDPERAVFSIHATSSASLTPSTHVVAHPSQIVNVVEALVKQSRGEHTTTALTSTQSAWIDQVLSTLKLAKKPVIITGTSLGDPQLVKLVKQFAITLVLNGNDDVRMAYVVPDANSVGLALLKPKPIEQALARIEKNPVDVAFVLENNLTHRLGQNAFAILRKQARQIIVIQSHSDNLSEHADVVFASATFLESTGTMVSAEGRMQHSFGPAPALSDAPSARDILLQLCDSTLTNDDVLHKIAKDLQIDDALIDELYDRNFRVLDQKIALFPPGSSGRTAIATHLSMHEQKPPVEKDSPFAYSMEGARKKIPLPLIARSWKPGWNSKQASFQTILNAENHGPDAFGGIRLFSKINKAAFTPITTTPSSSLPLPQLLGMPSYHIFASAHKAKYIDAFSTLLPKSLAYIAKSDAEELGIKDMSSIVVTSQHARKTIMAKIDHEQLPGLILLPAADVDASFFFAACSIHVVNKEHA